MMMTAAMSAVIVWRSAATVRTSSSIPAMSAAFATHFILCTQRAESNPNPFGRYSLPTQKTVAVGAAVVLVMFGGLEGAYLAVAPDSEGAQGDNPYQLTYTVSEWTEEATLTLSDGDTQTFEVTIDDTMTGVVIAELKITYSDTGETFTAACDEVVTTPDYSGLAGPLSESDDTTKSTTACDTTTVVGTIRPNTDLDQYANEGQGNYTLNGTESELIDILTTLGKSPEMVGTVAMDVALNTNEGSPFGNDDTETVTVVLSMLIFQPSGTNPVTA